MTIYVNKKPFCTYCELLGVKGGLFPFWDANAKTSNVPNNYLHITELLKNRRLCSIFSNN